MKMQTRILIVDDDARFCARARTVLETSGYTIAAEAADGAQALAAVERFSPDAAFVDVQLPDIDGLALTRRLHQTDGSLRIVLTSTDPTLVAPAALAQSGAVAFVPKDKLAITDLAPLLGDDRGQATGKPHARSSVRPIPAAHCRAYGPAMLNPQPHQLGWTNDQLSAIRREVAAETEDQS
jgi:CheY-like chemotaxis protein